MLLLGLFLLHEVLYCVATVTAVCFTSRCLHFSGSIDTRVLMCVYVSTSWYFNDDINKNNIPLWCLNADGSNLNTSNFSLDTYICRMKAHKHNHSISCHLTRYCFYSFFFFFSSLLLSRLLLFHQWRKKNKIQNKCNAIYSKLN